MKRPRILTATIAALSFLIVRPVSAVVIDGELLKIGPNNAVSYESGAIGQDNDITYASTSLVVGFDNTADEFTYNALILGYANHVMGGMESYTSECLVVGSENEVGGSDTTYNSILAGESSSAKGLNFFASGYGNEIFANEGGTIGRGLINYQDYQLVIGAYNKAATTQGEAARLFTIGNGVGDADNQRSNALIVYQNGNAALQGGLTINNGQSVLTQSSANTQYMPLSPVNVGIGTATPSAKLDITTNSLGTNQTTSSGLALVNTTAASSGVQQISPAIRWSGQGWVTSQSKSVDFQAFITPVQNSGGAIWKLQSSLGGGSYTDRLTVSSVSGEVIASQFRATGAISAPTIGANSINAAHYWGSSIGGLVGANCGIEFGEGVTINGGDDDAENDFPVVIKTSGAYANGSITLDSPTIAMNGRTSIGSDLTVNNSAPAQLVVGTYNNTAPDTASGTDRTQGVLVVGTGTDDQSENALRVVKKNGKSLVLVQESGDLSMGQFTAGEKP